MIIDHIGVSVSDYERSHGAFVIGPDGHNVEAVCHAPEV